MSMESKIIKKKSKRGGYRKNAGRRKGALNKSTRLLKDLANEHTEAAINVLVEVMQDPEAPHAARVSAADKILDRGHGKPPVYVDPGISDKLGPELLKRLETEMVERMERSRQRQQAVLLERGITIDNE